MARARNRTEEATLDRSTTAAEMAVATDPTGAFAQATATQQEAPSPVVAAPAVNGAGMSHEPGREEPERTNVTHAAIVTDAAAKIRFHFNYAARPQLAAIPFDDGEPPEEARAEPEAAGFKRKNEATAWEHPIEFATRAQDRQHARATFEKVAEMRHEEVGVGQAR